MHIYLVVNHYNTPEGFGTNIACYDTLEPAMQHYEFFVAMSEDDINHEPFVDGKLDITTLNVTDKRYPHWSLTKDNYFETIEIQRKLLKTERH